MVMQVRYMEAKDKKFLIHLPTRIHAFLARMSEKESLASGETVSMGTLVRRALVSYYKIPAATTPTARRRQKKTQ